MKIVEVNEENLAQAGRIHSLAWQESHRSFCTPEFVAKHSPEAQTEYLRRERVQGKRVWMLVDGKPVGIVSVQGSLIENLYVLPGEQNRGYGTRLLRFAMAQCQGTPALWILSSNEGALRLYARHGFVKSGRENRLSETLYELELMYEGEK